MRTRSASTWKDTLSEANTSEPRQYLLLLLVRKRLEIEDDKVRFEEVDIHTLRATAADDAVAIGHELLSDKA